METQQITSFSDYNKTSYYYNDNCFINNLEIRSYINEHFSHKHNLLCFEKCSIWKLNISSENNQFQFFGKIENPNKIFFETCNFKDIFPIDMNKYQIYNYSNCPKYLLKLEFKNINFSVDEKFYTNNFNININGSISHISENLSVFKNSRNFIATGIEICKEIKNYLSNINKYFINHNSNTEFEFTIPVYKNDKSFYVSFKILKENLKKLISKKFSMYDLFDYDIKITKFYFNNFIPFFAFCQNQNLYFINNNINNINNNNKNKSNEVNDILNQILSDKNNHKNNSSNSNNSDSDIASINGSHQSSEEMEFEKEYSLEGENLQIIWSGFLTKNNKDRTSVDMYKIRGNIDDSIIKEVNINVFNKVSYDEVLQKRELGLVAISPQSITQKDNFDSFITYLHEKQRCGVVNLSGNKYILYLVSPSEFSKKFYINPKKHLLGIFVDISSEQARNPATIPPPVISLTEKRRLMSKSKKNEKKEKDNEQIKKLKDDLKKLENISGEEGIKSVEEMIKQNPELKDILNKL